MIIEILLAIYVGLWLWRTYKPTTIKKYFQKQYKDLVFQIADIEFKRFKTKEGREELRQEYDKMKSKREVLKEQIELEKKAGKKSIDEIKGMEDDLVRLEQQIKYTEEGKPDSDQSNYVMNLKDFDSAIALNNSQIDQLRSLRGLLKEYIVKEL